MKLVQFLCIVILWIVCGRSACLFDGGSNARSHLTQAAGDSKMCRKLQDAFDGRSTLYAIAVTRSGSEVLTPVEIHTVFAVLRELLCEHDEHYLGALQASIAYTQCVPEEYSHHILGSEFLETCREFSKSSVDHSAEFRHLIECATDKYISRKEILDEIRSNIQLIVFNEYFFGGKVGFVDDYLDNILYKSTKCFSNAFFFVNFLRQSVQKTSILDLDRSISILSAPLTFQEARMTIESQHYIEQRSGLFAVVTGVNEVIRTFKQRVFPRLLQYEVRESKTGGVEDGIIREWISFLSSLKERTCVRHFSYPCLENVSISIFQDKPLTFYRKSTYASEFTKLTLGSAADQWFLYLFGNGIDLLFDQEDQLARILWENISSEICLDLQCAIRSKDASPKKVHIVQSNCIQMKDKLEKALPICEHVLHADPSYVNCYTFNKAANHLAAKHVIFTYRFEMNGESYVINIFRIN